MEGSKTTQRLDIRTTQKHRYFLLVSADHHLSVVLSDVLENSELQRVSSGMVRNSNGRHIEFDRVQIPM